MGSSITTKSKIMRKFSLYRKCSAWNSLPLKPADAEAHTKSLCIRIQKSAHRGIHPSDGDPAAKALLKTWDDMSYWIHSISMDDGKVIPARLQKQCLLCKLMILAYKNSKKSWMSPRTVPKGNFKPVSLTYPANLLQLQDSGEPCERFQAHRCLATALCGTVAPSLT